MLFSFEQRDVKLDMGWDGVIWFYKWTMHWGAIHSDRLEKKLDASPRQIGHVRLVWKKRGKDRGGKTLTSETNSWWWCTTKKLLKRGLARRISGSNDTHCYNPKVWIKRNGRSYLRLPWERPWKELRNEPPHDIASPQVAPDPYGPMTLSQWP